MSSTLKEFRDFLMRGNLIQLAVAFVMGVAFAAVINSFVTNLVMPIIAAIVGKPNFDDLTFTIHHSVFTYGTFITDVITFVAIAAAVFFSSSSRWTCSRSAARVRSLRSRTRSAATRNCSPPCARTLKQPFTEGVPRECRGRPPRRSGTQSGSVSGNCRSRAGGAGRGSYGAPASRTPPCRCGDRVLRGDRRSPSRSGCRCSRRPSSRRARSRARAGSRSRSRSQCTNGIGGRQPQFAWLQPGDLRQHTTVVLHARVPGCIRSLEVVRIVAAFLQPHRVVSRARRGTGTTRCPTRP